MSWQEVENLSKLSSHNLQLVVSYLDDIIEALHECNERLKKALELKHNLVIENYGEIAGV